MNSEVNLNIRLVDQSEGLYLLALTVRNDSASRLLIPWPEIIGFRFLRADDLQEAEWGTCVLEHTSWGGGVLTPGEAKEFVFRIVVGDAPEEPTDDELISGRWDLWCVDLRPGVYVVSYRLNVDVEYFDPDSHYRLPQLQREAEAHSAKVWLREAISNELRLVHTANGQHADE